MTARPLNELVAPDWAAALTPVEPKVSEVGRFLRAELAAGRGYLPAGENVLRAFGRPLADVRVLIVGQDPYPTPGHPVGLSFSSRPKTCERRSFLMFSRMPSTVVKRPPIVPGCTSTLHAGTFSIQVSDLRMSRDISSSLFTCRCIRLPLAGISPPVLTSFVR